jgi:hypothetical protein
VTSASSTAAVKVTNDTTVRLLAAVGTTGVWGELGMKYNWNDLSSTYFAVRHGHMGTICKCKVQRGSTVIEGHMLVSMDYSNWQTAVAAIVLPSVTNLIITRCTSLPVHCALQIAVAHKIALGDVDQVRARVGPGESQTLWPARCSTWPVELVASPNPLRSFNHSPFSLARHLLAQQPSIPRDVLSVACDCNASQAVVGDMPAMSTIDTGPNIESIQDLLSYHVHRYATGDLSTSGGRQICQCTCRGIIAPIMRSIKARRAAAVRQERREELHKLKCKAEAQQCMMRPLIKRMRAEEARSKGLVIVKARPILCVCNSSALTACSLLVCDRASGIGGTVFEDLRVTAATQTIVFNKMRGPGRRAWHGQFACSYLCGMQAMYGDLHQWKRVLVRQVDRLASSSSAGDASCSASTSGAPSHVCSPDRNMSMSSDLAADSIDLESSNSVSLSPVPEGGGTAEPPPLEDAWSGDDGCLDVTMALQFQVHRGELTLPSTSHKHKLLGFADLSPEGDKTVYVMYLYKGVSYELEGVLQLCARRCVLVHALWVQAAGPA